MANMLREGMRKCVLLMLKRLRPFINNFIKKDIIYEEKMEKFRLHKVNKIIMLKKKFSKITSKL